MIESGKIKSTLCKLECEKMNVKAKKASDTLANLAKQLQK